MRLRNVIVMLILAALCALAWFSLQDTATTSGGPKLQATMPEFVKDQVTKVTATFDGKPLVLRRRTDRTDAWEVEIGLSSLRADAVAVDELLTQLGRQDVRAKYDRAKLNDGDLHGYGLDAPQGTVELETAKEKVLVRYGKKTREGTGAYVDTGAGTDVWVVGGTVVNQALAMAASGAQSKRYTDLRLYDIGKLEIVKGGVTTLLCERDPSQIWRVSQPWRGFADPQEFEHLIDRLVTTEVGAWVEVGAQDLKRWGLDAPRSEVRLTHKKGGDAVVLLVGAAAPDGGAYIMEKGRPNVAQVPKRFMEAVDADADSIRDRSFSRLGNDGVALKVKLGESVYELRKEGSSWDITAPDRYPCDDASVRDAMELVRSWRTVEFNDAAKPGDYGLTDGADFVEVELQGGGKTVFHLSKESGADGTRWARRVSAEGESGVERADGAPIERLAKGYAQFRRKQVREFSAFLSDLERIARDGGRSDEGKQVQTVVIERAVVDRAGTDATAAWKLSGTAGPGQAGTIDAGGVSRLIAALSQIIAKDWVLWNTAKNDEMGFYAPLAETFSLGLRFNTRTGSPPDGAEQILLVGKKRPEGGYYAKFGGDQGWAFVLSDDDVKALMTPLSK